MKQLRILVFPPLKKKSVHPGVTPSVKSVTPKKKFFGTHNDRLDFRRLPGPVFDPPRRDECRLIFPNSGW